MNMRCSLRKQDSTCGAVYRFSAHVSGSVSSRELSIRNFQDTLVVRRVRKDPSAYGLPGRRISSSHVGNVVVWCMEGDDGGIIMGSLKLALSAVVASVDECRVLSSDDSDVVRA